VGLFAKDRDCEPTKDNHANNSSSEGQTAEGCAIVVVVNCGSSMNSFQN